MPIPTARDHSSHDASATDRAARSWGVDDENVDRPDVAAQHRVAQLEERVEGLSRALQTRDTIGQAKGILNSHFAIDPDEAFALLARLSQHTNTKLADLAADLVALACDQDRHDRPGPNRAATVTVFDGLLGNTAPPAASGLHRAAPRAGHRTGDGPR